MRAVDAAIKTKFTTKVGDSYPALYTDVNGRMYNTWAPQQTVYPYILYQDITGTPDINFTHNHRELLYQFSLFSAEASISEIGKMEEDLLSLFEGCTLSVTDWTFTFMQEEQTRGPDRDEDKIWMVTTDFRIHIEKIRT